MLTSARMEMSCSGYRSKVARYPITETPRVDLRFTPYSPLTSFREDGIHYAVMNLYSNPRLLSIMSYL